MNVKFGTGELTSRFPDLRSAPPCQISRLSGRNVEIQPTKLSKFRILAINLCLRGTHLQYFYEILSVCTRLQVTFKFLIWSLWGDKQPSGAPPCQILRLSGQKCGNTAPKTVKISNIGDKFTPPGGFVCCISTKFSAFVRVYR